MTSERYSYYSEPTPPDPALIPKPPFADRPQVEDTLYDLFKGILPSEVIEIVLSYTPALQLIGWTVKKARRLYDEPANSKIVRCSPSMRWPFQGFRYLHNPHNYHKVQAHWELMTPDLTVSSLAVHLKVNGKFEIFECMHGGFNLTIGLKLYSDDLGGSFEKPKWLDTRHGMWNDSRTELTVWVRNQGDWSKFFEDGLRIKKLAVVVKETGPGSLTYFFETHAIVGIYGY